MDNRKSLLRNSVYNVMYKTLNIVFPMITSMYVARILAADSIGKVAAAQNIVSYFTLLAAMGIPTYGVKLIAQYTDKSMESSKAFSELFLINFILSMFCSIAYYLLIFTVGYFDGKELLYAICGLNIIFNVFNVDWFYQGVQEYGYIALRSFLFKCLSMFALVLLVRSSRDYIFYALISSGALVGNYIFNIVRIRRYVSFSFKGLHFDNHLRHIFTLFIATIAVEVYVLADTTMLDVLCDSAIVGYYTMSMRVIKIVRSLVVAVSAVFLPQLSFYYFNGKWEEFFKLVNRGAHILVVMSVPATLGLLLVANEVVLVFFGSGFSESIFTTRVLAISIVTVALSNFTGLQILVTIGKEKITTISTICGALVNITLNYFLIRLYQHNGAAIASVITEGLVMTIQLVLARKYFKFKFGWMKILLAASCMVVSVILIKQIFCPPILKLVLECCIGVVVYIIALVIGKDEFVLSALKALRKKMGKRQHGMENGEVNNDYFEKGIF